MKKLYKVASALDIQPKTIKNLIDHNKVNYELRGGVYYVDQNEVSEAHRLNRIYFVRISLGRFELDFNDTDSCRCQNVRFERIGQFIEEWLKYTKEDRIDCDELEVTHFEGSNFTDVTLYVDIGDCEIEEILEETRYMRIPKYRMVNDDDLSQEEYERAYFDSWKYVALCGCVSIIDYGWVQNQKLAA